jgi:hypothetical protein
MIKKAENGNISGRTTAESPNKRPLRKYLRGLSCQNIRI